MKQRIISAIIMLIVFIPLLIIGKLPFAGLILLLGMIALHELLKFRKNLPIYVVIITHIFTAILILYNLLFNNLLLAVDYKVLLLIPLIYLILLVFINNQKKYNYKDAFYLIASTFFIGLAFNNLIYLRNLGIYYLVYLFGITILTDTFAYLIGSKFGKHKIFPDISPNKSLEGAIAGTMAGTMAGTLIYFFLISNKNIFIIIVLTLFLSIIGQIGDLVKSSIKRYEKIKDFSNLIPGHGGVLDRLDSIIFVAITYILISNLY